MQTLQISASAVKAHELEQLEGVADQLEDNSELSTYVRGVVTELRGGSDLTTLESTAEVSPTDAAKFLKMSRTFLMQYIAKGELNSHKVGAHHRISMPDLLEFRDRVVGAREAVANALGAPTTVKQTARDRARARARAAREAGSAGSED